jgi:uncharacterized cupredoxin-like copper-binding protein
MFRSRPLAALVAAAAMVAGAHARAETAHAQQAAARVSAARVPAARVLTITARNYAFEAPATIPAGRTEIRLVNAGPELHHAYFIKLDEGKTPADLMKAMQGGHHMPSWAREVGGPNTPAPGKTSVAVLDLKPGTYMLTCVIPSPDGAPHIAKGMTTTLTVTEPTTARAASARAEPRGAVGAPTRTMKLVDYGFELDTPLVAGKQVVRVQNLAEQGHEVVIIRHAPGKTAQQVMAWLEKMDGPPPGEPVGGTTNMAKGEWNDVVLDLTPGDYTLVCFAPDHKDGKPHVAHGMIRTITVK